MRLVRTLLAVCLLVSVPAFAEEFDDCDANFIAFIGSSAYQFSPVHDGELGTVRLFAILSYQRAAAQKRFGYALWQLRIDRAEDGERVFTLDGRAHIGQEGAAVAELWWDGRDDAGQLVPAGKYRYTFAARYLDRERGRFASYDAAFDGDEAVASSDEVIVDYSLPVDTARGLRVTANVTSCQIQQHTPMEAGFPYNFYYGSTHSHSNWSDGGQPTTNCLSSNAYGSGTFTPADVFNYARNTAGLDFWVVNEHNHLIQDAIATNNAPVTEAKVKQRYQDGRTAATNATVNGSFVALYGMEWGVTSNTDQGHVTLIDTPVLLGWETCTTCNGPSAECTPGSNCYFDVFTPKRYNYLAMYAASVAHPSSAGPLGIFNHPSTGNFDNFAYNANADDAIQGIAVRSGLAFSTATNCANTNVGATDYTVQWKDALNRGFHLAPAADHDSHCNNYGMALPTRTVYLAAALTKADLLAAQRARHFYASEDPNAQMVFRTSDNAHVMGDIFNSAGGATLVAHLYDPDGESTSTLEIWRGQIGGGVPSAAYATYSNTSSATITESLTSGTYYYFVHAVQADGHDVWSAPMWITYTTGGGGDTTAPTASITAPSNGATVSGTTSVTANASDNAGVARVDFLLDGSVQSSDSTSPYSWSWNTASSSNASHTLVAKAYDAANNVGTSSTITVTVSNSGGGTSASVGGWKVTQANSAGTYTIPAGTTIPADGYLVIARQADKAAFQTFWGVTLGSNVTFLNAAGAMPVINGDETFTLSNASSVVVDGPTPAMATSAAKSMQRTDPCGSTWNALADTSGNPGSGAGGGCAGGVKLNEFSDASGTGIYIYEFVELHNDAAAAGGDTTAPSTSITAPSNAATVSGTVSVTANASDNIGVTKVEFWLDGVLKSTDTSSPYAWSWDTTTATNASHSLQTRAYDAAGNVGTSSSVSVTVSNGVPVSIGGWTLTQANSTLTYTIPAGTTIPSHGYVIIARNATKTQFQTFWGVTLAANVVFINAADTMPQINGSETYTLKNGTTTIDGPTVAMGTSAGESLQRTNACGTTWNRLASSSGTPGTGAPAPCNKGAFISEFSDALGTGNYIYEFVEIANDR